MVGSIKLWVCNILDPLFLGQLYCAWDGEEDKGKRQLWQKLPDFTESIHMDEILKHSIWLIKENHSLNFIIYQWLHNTRLLIWFLLHVRKSSREHTDTHASCRASLSMNLPIGSLGFCLLFFYPQCTVWVSGVLTWACYFNFCWCKVQYWKITMENSICRILSLVQNWCPKNKICSLGLCFLCESTQGSSLFLKQFKIVYILNAVCLYFL